MDSSVIKKRLCTGFGRIDEIMWDHKISRLNRFFYETGTAYYKPAFSTRTELLSPQGIDRVKMIERLYLGLGKASSLGIHVGLEQGATGFVQQSTGNIITEPLNPALFVKSGLISWQER